MNIKDILRSINTSAPLPESLSGKTLSRRELLRLGGGALISAALFGCNGNNPDQAPAELPPPVSSAIPTTPESIKATLLPPASSTPDIFLKNTPSSDIEKIIYLKIGVNLIPVCDVKPISIGGNIILDNNGAKAFLARTTPVLAHDLKGNYVNGYPLSGEQKKRRLAVTEIWDQETGFWKTPDGNPLRRFKVAKGQANVSLRKNDGKKDGDWVQTDNDPPLTKIPGSPYSNFKIDGKDVKMIPVYNPNLLEIAQTSSSDDDVIRFISSDLVAEIKDIPERVASRPWILSDTAIGPYFTKRTFIDPLTEEEVLRTFSCVNKIYIPKEIIIDDRQKGENFSVSSNNKYAAEIFKTDDLGLTNPAGSGKEALDNAIIWIISKKIQLPVKEVKEKAVNGTLPIFDVNGKKWDPNKGFDLFFYETILNQDTKVHAVSGGIGCGYDITNDGLLRLLPEVTELTPIQQDINKAEYTKESLNLLANDLAIPMEKMGNRPYSYSISLIIDRQYRDKDGTFHYWSAFISK